MGLYSDVLFYSTAWMLAAVCALLSTFRDHRYRDAWELVATASLSGFVAVGFLGVLLRSVGSVADSQPYYLGIAIAVGILGEQGIRLAQWIVAEVFHKFGILDKNSASNRSNPQRSDKSDDSSRG